MTFGSGAGVALADVGAVGCALLGVGHDVVDEGRCPVSEATTRVVVWNTNLDRDLTIDAPVRDCEPIDEGDCVASSVPDSGAAITVDLSAATGGRLGAMLPTGRALQRLQLPVWEMSTSPSFSDVDNPHVFMRADCVGLRGPSPRMSSPHAVSSWSSSRASALWLR